MNSQGKPRNPWIWCRLPIRKWKNQVFTFFGKKWQKISCRTFYRKPIWLSFVSFSTTFRPRLSWGNTFSFLTWSRPLDFTFPGGFSILKDPFPLRMILSVTQLQQRPKYDIFQRPIFCILKYEFGTKYRSNCSRAVFMKRFYFFLFFY